MLPAVTIMGGIYLKRLFAMFLAAVLLLSASGCGIKRRIEDKIGEAVGEKMIEKMTGQEVDVEGDEITIKGEDGAEITFGSGEWPDNELMKDVPKFEKGTIADVTKSDSLNMILFTDVKQKDYENYRDKIKEAFTVDAVDLKMDNVITYAGSNGKGVYIQISFNTDDNTVTFSVTKSDE